MICFASKAAGEYRHTKPICNTFPEEFLASNIASHCASDIAIGFSRSTCFPAFNAAIASSAWRSFGTAITTPSISSLSSNNSTESHTSHPCNEPNDSDFSFRGSCTAATVVPILFAVSAWMFAIIPAPISPIFVIELIPMFLKNVCHGLQVQQEVDALPSHHYQMFRVDAPPDC